MTWIGAIRMVVIVSKDVMAAAHEHVVRVARRLHDALIVRSNVDNVEKLVDGDDDLPEAADLAFQDKDVSKIAYYEGVVANESMRFMALKDCSVNSEIAAVADWAVPRSGVGQGALSS